MIDDELMAAVWADPDCPVELSSEGKPWPREKATSVFKGEPWTFECRCRDRRPPVVRMQGRVWLVNEPGRERSVLVYLGQCGDCGRVYWSIVK